MGLSDFKITDADITSKGVQASPDQLSGTAEDNKKVFDRLTSGPVRDGHNKLIDALVALGVEQLIQYGSEDIKYIRLNADEHIEVPPFHVPRESREHAGRHGPTLPGDYHMTSAERREGRYQRRKARRQERRQRRMAALGTIEDIARFDRMYQCGKDCCRGVRWKTSIQAFEAELFLRTAWSCRLVEGGAWRPQRKPVHFTVMERGKVRPIDAPHVDDRQVQKAHSRFVLTPCYGPAMIYDNGASQQGKGLEFAYRRLKRALMRHYRRYGREGSVILCDLKEFFPSAPRRALLDRHRRYMPEGPIRALADEMVLTAPETEPGRGMPLGMEQSQQEMVALPSAVDNWLRCQMHMEAQHYMDDYVILVPPGVDAAAVLEAFIARCEALGLRVNRRKCRYAPLRRPFRYCKTKFRLTETGRVVTHRTGDAQRRCRRKMRLLAARGDWEGVRAQIVSAKGYYKRHNDNGRLTALRALHSALRKERAA